MFLVKLGQQSRIEKYCGSLVESDIVITTVAIGLARVPLETILERLCPYSAFQRTGQKPRNRKIDEEREKKESVFLFLLRAIIDSRLRARLREWVLRAGATTSAKTTRFTFTVTL